MCKQKMEVNSTRGQKLPRRRRRIRAYLVKAKLKLKFKKKHCTQKSVKPYGVEKLKNDTSSALYQTELSNRFQQLQQATDIEEQ